MVLFFARSAVSQHGGARVEVAHLMLGILAAAPDAVTKVATVSGPVEHIRERAMKMLGAENERPGKGVDVPLSKDCQRALERGAREASALNSRDIRPEHLLLALLNDEAVSPMLGEIGVSRSSVLAFLKEK
jgi:ATP-dependent Clp protease ATP-binding subunit ClpC